MHDGVGPLFLQVREKLPGKLQADFEQACQIEGLCFFSVSAPRTPATATQNKTMSSQTRSHHSAHKNSSSYTTLQNSTINRRSVKKRMLKFMRLPKAHEHVRSDSMLHVTLTSSGHNFPRRFPPLQPFPARSLSTVKDNWSSCLRRSLAQRTHESTLPSEMAWVVCNVTQRSLEICNTLCRCP